MKTVFLLLAITSLLSAGAFGATEKEPYMVKGAGNGSCENFVSERRDRTDTYKIYGGWIAGYLTGYNRYTEDTFDIVPWQGIDLLAVLLDNFCRKNPEVRFINAVDAMIASLLPTRLRNPSETLEIRSKDRSFYVLQSVLKMIQERLEKKGYYQDNIDGVWGENTKEALEAFQKENGLPTSGVPDQHTLFVLFKGT